MLIHYYPDIAGGGPSPGSVRKFIDHLAKSEPALYALVKETFDKLEEPAATLDAILPSWVGHLSNLGVPVCEFRIPPTRSGGL